MTSLPVSKVRFREDLYPRIKHDPALVRRYAEDLAVLPPIEVNQQFESIDGYHRWTAHRKAEAERISAKVTKTESDAEFLALAIRRNSAHGWQMDERRRRKAAVRLYEAGTGLEKSVTAGRFRKEKRKPGVTISSQMYCRPLIATGPRLGSPISTHLTRGKLRANTPTHRRIWPTCHSATLLNTFPL